MANRYGIPDIILKNKQHCIHFFDKDGNYVDLFTGLDGKVYGFKLPYQEWPDEVWEMYEQEGITLDGPTPIEEINYPKKSSE